MDVPFDLWGQCGGPGIDVIGEPQYAAPIRDVLGTSFLYNKYQDKFRDLL